MRLLTMHRTHDVTTSWGLQCRLDAKEQQIFLELTTYLINVTCARTLAWCEDRDRPSGWFFRMGIVAAWAYEWRSVPAGLDDTLWKLVFAGTRDAIASPLTISGRACAARDQHS